MEHNKQHIGSSKPDIRLAVEFHRAGRLQEAEAIYKQLPFDPDALHLRGLIAHQATRYEEAVEFIRQAIRIQPSNEQFHFSIESSWRALNRLDEVVSGYMDLLRLQPGNAAAHNNLGNALKDLGQFEEATKHYQAALALKPDFVEAHSNLGLIHAAQGRQDDAIKSYRRALALRPGFTIAHINLGISLRLLGRLDEAEQSCREALRLEPNSADAFIHLGHTLKEQGKLDDATVCYLNALELRPRSADTYSALGNVLMAQGKLEDALLCQENAIVVNPDCFDAYHSLGMIFHQQGRFSDAINSYLQAITLKPAYAEAHNNLGQTFADQGNENEAYECYRTALTLNPNLAEANNNLGVLFRNRGQLDEAIACYLGAIAARPEFAPAHANLGICFKEQGKLDEAVNCYRQAISYNPGYANAYHHLLLAMQYSASHTAEQMYAAHVEFGKIFETPLRARWVEHSNKPDTNKRLKIGYVSPDLHRHSVAYFIEPVLACHDKSAVEVFCYYSNTHIDAVTLRLQQLADHWIPCKHLSDDRLAARIREDGIDILIDLAGHTGGNRLLTFARKPAPVQVTYLGHPATTGLTAIDYRLTDGYAEPPGMTEALNVEQLWRLPDLFCCYRAHDNSPDVIDHPPALDNGFVTFGCFNNFSKVTDPVLALWAKVLQRLPEARLMLEIAGLNDPVFRAEIEARMVRLGLPLEQVLLVPRRPENQYVLYNQIDIALDPFPCNGGTTSLDTLWMGVPLITLAGRHFTSRMGVTILSNAGLPELVAQSEEEYVELAVALASDLSRLSNLRHGLRQRVQASPLMDAPRFTHNLEAAYRGMWEQWCKNKLETESHT